MKMSMNPILVALLAGGSCSIGHTAVAVVAPEVRSEVRTVIIDSDTAGLHGQQGHQGPETAEVVIAQSEPGSHRKEVRVITSGPHVNLPDFPDIDMIISDAMSEAFSAAVNMPMARNVKNAPYSADVISEKIQPLPDGNQITRKTSSKAYRDSAGRTRQETLDSKGEVRSVQIHDAVEGSRFMLSPARKSATRISVDKDLHKRIEEITEKARTMARDGKAQIIERSNPGEEIIVKHIESPASDGRKDVREEVRVKVVRSGGGSGPAGSPAYPYAYDFGGGESIGQAIGESMRHGPIGMSFQDMKWSGKAATTPLGTRDFDGVRAEGKSVSYTIPAGEIGNKNSIVVSTETWTSADLQVVVYSRHSDPRVGDSIYRLANVKRTEQPAALFAVPDGYSVKQSKESPGLAPGMKQK